MAHKRLKSQNSQNNSSIPDLVQNSCSLRVYIAVSVSWLQLLVLEEIYPFLEKSALKDLKDKLNQKKDKGPNNFLKKIEDQIELFKR